MSLAVRRVAAVVAVLASMLVLVAPSASASTSYTLPPALKQQLTSGLTACATNATCSAALWQAIATCLSYPSCNTALHQFLATNPDIWGHLTSARRSRTSCALVPCASPSRRSRPQQPSTFAQKPLIGRPSSASVGP